MDREAGHQQVEIESCRHCNDRTATPRTDRTPTSAILMCMTRHALFVALAVLTVARSARADVFAVCKAESKHIVAGTGQLLIAVIYPGDFPGRTTRTVLYPI